MIVALYGVTRLIPLVFEHSGPTWNLLDLNSQLEGFNIARDL
jgi:hypothetical protein